MAARNRTRNILRNALRDSNIRISCCRRLNFETDTCLENDELSTSSQQNQNSKTTPKVQDITIQDSEIIKEQIVQQSIASISMAKDITKVSEIEEKEETRIQDTEIINEDFLHESVNITSIAIDTVQQLETEGEEITGERELQGNIPIEPIVIDISTNEIICPSSSPTITESIIKSPDPIQPICEPNLDKSYKAKNRKAKIKKQYFDYYQSDEEDFTTIFGDCDDSDNYQPDSSSSEEEIPNNNSHETGVVGESGFRKRKHNSRKNRQQLRQSGKAYTRKDGTSIAAKDVKPNPCIGKRCGNGCGEIPEERRRSIFDFFWKLTSTRRKDWLVSMTEKVAAKRKRVGSDKRNITYKYFITEGEGKRQVCRQFLTATIDVGLKFVRYCIENSKNGLATEELRGRCEPYNKTKETTITAVKNYIKSLPAVPSHYTRKNSSRLYLPSEYKNLTRLYQMYKAKNPLTDIVSERVFRNIFHQSFNIGFHVPKKDKCVKCINFDNNPNDNNLQEEKKKHNLEKQESYDRFKAHQNIHKDDPTTLCVSFDLQKVLNTPYGESMLLFYSRKLAIYNLCFYESGTRQVYCYYWDQNNGKRGANEIATILSKYINMVDERGTVKNILLYCDCCPGQTRNKTIMAMLHNTVKTSKNIDTIQINFLLTGHTYMPADSVHAVIERNLRKSIIYAPSQWYTVFTTARQDPSPYNAELIQFKDFLNWDTIADKYFKGNLAGKISKFRVVTFRKNKEMEISAKYSMSKTAECQSIEVRSKIRFTPSQCYRTKIPISKAKHDDLLKLCKLGVIPAMFHDEYNNLVSVNSVIDTLNESDIEDIEDENEE